MERALAVLDQWLENASDRAAMTAAQHEAGKLTRTYGMAWGIGGWLLTPFLQKAGLARVAQLRDQVAAGLTTTFASSYTAQVSLPGALSLDAIARLRPAGDRLKYVIIPSPAA